MIEFAVAAKAAEVGEDEEVLKVPIDGVEYIVRKPTVGMGALLNVALASGDTIERLGAIYEMLEGMIGEEGRQHVERLIWARRLDIDDLIGGSEQNPKGGLIDQIFAEFSERPTPPSATSSSSRAAGGRRSTGRSPGKGSTRSASPSTDS